MSHDIPAPPINPSAQAARELAHRRWRPGNGDAATASPGSNAASALALHRWRPAPPPQAAATITPESLGHDVWGNLAILVILAPIAFAIYSSRREGEPPSRPRPGAGRSGGDASRDDWTVWLAGGVVALGGLLLACSPASRRNWGPVAGLACIALAAVLPVA